MQEGGFFDEKITALLCALILTLCLFTGCGRQKTALPEWLPEGSQDWQVDRMSLTVFPSGAIYGQGQLWSETDGGKSYRYNPTDGLRIEDRARKKNELPGSFAVEQMLAMFETVADWAEERFADQVGEGMEYGYLPLSQKYLESMQKSQAEQFAEGKTGYYFTYSLSTGEIVELTAPLEGDLEVGTLTLGFYSGFHLVDVFLID